MIAALIRWSIGNRLLVLLATAFLVVAGLWSVSHISLDAIPDLSDVQVIIRTPYPGKAPQIVEDQVTYPLTTTMLSRARRENRARLFVVRRLLCLRPVRRRHDPYWARSRVLEYLNQVQSRLPAGANASLGPDATGVGWIYEYALVDRTGRQDLSQLRALQDWFLKFELKTVPNVAEVASIGGMVRQYQIVLDPDRLRAFNITQAKVIDAVAKGQPGDGRLGRRARPRPSTWCARRGYLRSLDDFRSIPLALTDAASGAARATSPMSRSDRRCGAASPSSTAKAKLPAA